MLAMAGQDFDLALSAKVVDAVLVVPIDTEQITAAFRFDGAAQS